MNKEESARKLKLYVLTGVLVACTLGLMCRAFYLQVIQQDFLRRWADSQRMKPIHLTPLRGRILDRNGACLAVSVKAASVYSQRLNHAEPIKDPMAVVRYVAPYTRKRPQELCEILTQRSAFTWLARQIPMPVGREIQKLNCPTVGIEVEGKRYYPKKELAGQLLGCVGVDSQGLEGLERYYDRILKGKEVTLVLQRDALGRTLWHEVPETQQGSAAGKDLVLTIDTRIQFFTEKALAEAVEKCGARCGIVVVMHPISGEILAMASYPPFNPNAFQHESAFARKNHAVTDSFEPGSTAKVFTMAAALEEGVVDEGRVFNCENGSYAFGGRVIHDLHKYGQLTVREILIHSSNIGATKIAELLGAPRLYRYLSAFGFGSPTSVDLPGEVSGTLRHHRQWAAVALANHAFGQGFTVTPIQLAAAFSAIANGGFLVQPHVVKEIRDPIEGGKEIRTPKVVRRVISRATSERMLAIMEGVVEEGTGKQARIPGYRVAGKTGTAQKVDPATGAYSSSRYVASFIGIVPVEKPELVVVVILDDPAVRGTGGLFAAPVFREVAWNALRYRNVVPHGGQELMDAEEVREAAVHLEQKGVSGTTGKADGGQTDFVIPDLQGFSLRKALGELERYPVTVEIKGSGRVVSQSPPPGSTVRKGDRCVLEASPVMEGAKGSVPLT